MPYYDCYYYYYHYSCGYCCCYYYFWLWHPVSGTRFVCNFWIYVKLYQHTIVKPLFGQDPIVSVVGILSPVARQGHLSPRDVYTSKLEFQRKGGGSHDFSGRSRWHRGRRKRRSIICRNRQPAMNIRQRRRRPANAPTFWTLEQGLLLDRMVKVKSCSRFKSCPSIWI